MNELKLEHVMGVEQLTTRVSFNLTIGQFSVQAKTNGQLEACMHTLY